MLAERAQPPTLERKRILQLLFLVVGVGRQVVAQDGGDGRVLVARETEAVCVRRPKPEQGVIELYASALVDLALVVVGPGEVARLVHDALRRRPASGVRAKRFLAPSLARRLATVAVGLDHRLAALAALALALRFLAPSLAQRLATVAIGLDHGLAALAALALALRFLALVRVIRKSFTTSDLKCFLVNGCLSE